MFLIIVALAAFALGALNLVQVFLGRQVIGPAGSKRSPQQIRVQSMWAAAEYFAGAVRLALLGFEQFDWAVVAFVPAFAAVVGLMVARWRSLITAP